VSHWPFITDFSVLSTYRLMAYGREMITLPTLLMGHGSLYLYLTYRVGLLGSQVVSLLDSGTEGPGSNHSRDAVG